MIKTIAALFCLTLCPAFADPIVVPFEDAYLPFSAMGNDGKPAGFNVAVAEEIAERLDAEIEFTSVDFDTIQFGSWPSDWVFSVASMSRSTEREENFAFVGPYYFDQVVIVAGAHSGLGFDRSTLQGHDFGVCRGCIYALYLEGTDTLYIDGQRADAPFGTVTVKTYLTDFDVLRALGEADPPEIDYGVTSVFHALYYEDQGFPVRHDPEPLFVEPLWIVVPLSRPDDIAAVTAAFDDLKNSGRLAELSVAYLGADFTALPGTN
ncbi:transporter substrate-binding domain-containing protein [Defluviimonas sp. SAOS-178_SWC]|uniref:transporter substrate-binding domain-containing protein n=1 Tax=Defluviimonas sp. SAOS-178_SWC TaxID=3121287 RepID=UPI0032215490